jgi:hypothetical protein
MKKHRIKTLYRSPMGTRVWQIPGSKLQIMYAGTGARLRIGHDFLSTKGSMGTTIDHPSARDTYNTPREAEAAAARFVASLPKY